MSRKNFIFMQGTVNSGDKMNEKTLLNEECQKLYKQTPNIFTKTLYVTTVTLPDGTQHTHSALVHADSQRMACRLALNHLLHAK